MLSVPSVSAANIHSSQPGNMELGFRRTQRAVKSYTVLKANSRARQCPAHLTGILISFEPHRALLSGYR